MPQLLPVLLMASMTIACGLEPEDAEAAQQALGKAVDKTKGGLKNGASKAKNGIDHIKENYGPAAKRDWQRLEDAARDAWLKAPGADHKSEAEEGLPERWWEKAPEAASCPKDPGAPCKLERWFIIAAQHHPHRIKSELTLTPVYDPARPEVGNVGVEVQTIPKGHLLDVLGFADGDEIQKINGLPVAQPLSQVSLYGQLAEKDSFEVIFARNAKVTRRTIEVVESLKK